MPIAAIGLGQPDDQGKPLLTLADFAHLRSAQGLDRGQHVPPGDAVAGDRVLVDLDPHDRQQRQLIGGHVDRSANLAQHVGHLLAILAEAIEIVAKNLHPHVAANAGDHFVDPLFDRLGEQQLHAGQIFQNRLHLGGQLVLVRGPVASRKAA